MEVMKFYEGDYIVYLILYFNIFKLDSIVNNSKDQNQIILAYKGPNIRDGKI